MPKTVLAVLPLASRICAGQCTATTPEFHHRHPTWPDDELPPSVSGSILWGSFDVKGLGCSPPAAVALRFIHQSGPFAALVSQSRLARVPSSGMPCVAVKRLSVGNRIAGRESLAGRSAAVALSWRRCPRTLGVAWVLKPVLAGAMAWLGLVCYCAPAGGPDGCIIKGRAVA